jgi:hypothetical protein
MGFGMRAKVRDQAICAATKMVRSRWMPSSPGLTHVAMSVPEGTLTDEYRARLLNFYGRFLNWHEMESLRLPDRLTIAVGPSSYINVRERPDSMVSHGYEHFGILVTSGEALRQLWEDLAAETADLHLESLSTNDHGEGSFRFRYLLPMAVEAQFYATLL